MKTGIKLILLFFATSQLFAASPDTLKLRVEQNEFWWGGLSSVGHEMPYDAKSNVTHDLWGDNKGNQAQPILLSTNGRYVWSEDPIKYSFNKGELTVTTRTGTILHGTAGENLADAYEFVSNKFFPSNGKIPDELLFTSPQYNTWIELMYDQNEEDILQYAKDIIDNGYPPGVIMIDDNWQEDYGTWEFSPRRFNNPKEMIKKLHEMGFKVMMWICPFVSPDSETFRYLAAEGMLLLDGDRTQDILWANTKNKAAIFRWWNGASACLDLSNPKTQKWFKEQMDYLVEEYGVDGFKLDAGDARFYTGDIVSYNESTPNDHTTYFAEAGLPYPLNEYRASWKMAGLPLVQRLRDKRHNWGDLQKLIPDQMSQSVMGYAYTCPDMIGGGEYQSFLKSASMDEELVVRSAQVHALMPMMQFSVAPWRILSEENQQICLDMAKLHEKMGPKIIELAKHASKTGEPIVKPMALAYPNNKGYESIKDQFMLGDDILVAPVVEKGARSRKVVFPEGKWKGDDGSIVEGGKTIKIQVPLERLPYFKKQ
ncbi:MAG: glycoside hydrolase family 31 protein [Prolixibacteraceae bacterium]|nr:glycoside hydrolase family 31 protein [Prolixibacteraceae bacterium]